VTRRERLRRVVILSASFARNVAYFRAGRSETGSAARVPSQPGSAFWTQISANFLEIAVLEWCKLLGDEKDKHFWRNIVIATHSIGLADASVDAQMGFFTLGGPPSIPWRMTWSFLSCRLRAQTSQLGGKRGLQMPRRDDRSPRHSCRSTFRAEVRSASQTTLGKRCSAN
jgi:hypothetical protein